MGKSEVIKMIDGHVDSQPVPTASAEAVPGAPVRK
jgi:hypothetical protein